MKTQTLEVPNGLLEAIAEYLATKPYREVNAMLVGLQQVKLARAAPELTDEREMPAG